MRAEDFSVWLCGVARLSADQRRKALAALANLDGGRHGSAPKAASETAANGGTGKGAEGAKRRRPDALGTSGHERVESQGRCHMRKPPGRRRRPGDRRLRPQSQNTF